MTEVGLARTTVASSFNLLQNLGATLDAAPVGTKQWGPDFREIRELLSRVENLAPVDEAYPLNEAASNRLEECLQLYQELELRLGSGDFNKFIPDSEQRPKKTKEHSDNWRLFRRIFHRKSSGRVEKPDKVEKADRIEKPDKVGKEIALAITVSSDAMKLYRQLMNREIRQDRLDTSHIITLTSPRRSYTSSSSGSGMSPPASPGRPNEYSERIIENLEGQPQLHSRYRGATFDLNIPDYPRRHLRYNDVRFPNTYDWFDQKKLLSHKGQEFTFAEWKNIINDNDGSILLWCCGVPGIGKSTLVSKLIDDCQKSKRPCAFFYTGVRTKHRAWDVAASILQQCCDPNDRDWSDVRRHFESRQIDVYSNLKTLLESIESLAPIRRYIFLDAWDLENMQDPENFSAILHTLSQSKCRVFVTSRKEHNELLECSDSPANRAWHFGDLLRCTMNSGDTEDDIQKYARYRIDTTTSLQELCGSDEKLRGEVLTNLRDKSNGLFFHAEIQMKLLSQECTARDLRRTLSKLPSKTEDILQAALGLVKLQSRNLRTLAQTTLVWLSQAKGPISARGLCEALALRRDLEDEWGGDRLQAFYPKPDSIPTAEIVILCCKGLVTLDYAESGVVLAHYYELAPFLEQFWPEIYNRELEYLTLTCVSYLLLDPFKHGPYSNQNSLSLLQEKYPFLHYAAVNWHLHLQQLWRANEDRLRPPFLNVDQSNNGHSSIPDQVERKWKHLADSESNVRLAFQIYLGSKNLGSRSNPTFEVSRVNCSTLQIATSLQLEPFVQYLIQRGSHSADPEKYFESRIALQEASYYAKTTADNNGSALNIFELLFRLFVLEDFNSATLVSPFKSDSLAHKILPSFSERERSEFFNIYLDKIHRSNSLDAAIENSDELAIIVMLTRTSISIQERTQGLHRAVKWRKRNAIKVLLAFGTDPYLEQESGPHSSSALRQSIQQLDLDIMTDLLRLSSLPPPHRRSDNYPQMHFSGWSQLVEEAITSSPKVPGEKSLEMVKALMDFEHTSKPIPSLDSALRNAISHDREDIVDFLLQNKANPNTTHPCSEHPAVFDSLGSHTPVILKLLLSNGADSNTMSRGRSLLHQACESGGPQFVQTLLSFNPNVNTVDQDGCTALFYAIREKDIQTVRLLVEGGVDLNIANCTGLNALHEAAIVGDEGILFFLLSGYDDISPRSEAGLTPLDYAKAKGYGNIVSLFETRIPLIRRRIS